MRTLSALGPDNNQVSFQGSSRDRPRRYSPSGCTANFEAGDRHRLLPASPELSPSGVMRLCCRSSCCDGQGARVCSTNESAAGARDRSRRDEPGNRFQARWIVRPREGAATLAPGTWRMRPPGRTGPDWDRDDGPGLDDREALNCRKTEGLCPCGRAALPYSC